MNLSVRFSNHMLARPNVCSMLAVRYRAICVAVLLSTLLIAGCGTVANLVSQRPEDNPRTPFGGVRQDVSCIRKAANGEFDLGIHPRSEPEQHAQVVPMLL